MSKKLSTVLLLFFFLFLLFSFLARAFYIQIIKHKEYSLKAEKQRGKVLILSAKRGTIYTSDNFPLASTKMSFILIAEPNRIKDVEGVVEKVAGVTAGPDKYEEEKGDLLKSLSNKDSYYAVLKKNLDLNQKNLIQNLGLEGIYFEETYFRFYPENDMASHLLGFVASGENEEEQGYYGLEGFYNGDLQGLNGALIEEKDAYGNPISLGTYKRTPARDGRNLVLSIDRNIQFILEEALKKYVKDYDALSGTILVMDPKTGEILGMANFPNYNPFDVSQLERTALVNKAISSIYEPGSVIKGLTMSAGIDMKKVTPESTYQDDGPKVFSGYTVDNWDKKHHGLETMTSILQHSNNLGAAYVGSLIGAKGISEYFAKFGLGEKSGIDLEGEDTGGIKSYSYKDWSEIDIATASFGQGISATPLQVVMAFGAIANEGKLMKPFLVKKIMDNNGKVVTEFKPKVIRQVISKKSAETMVDMLTKAVSGGEASYFVSKNYFVAGKTGTAQIPVRGGYDPNKTNATFVGFLPFSRKYVMLVKFEEPKKSVYASETSVPVWMDVSEKLSSYLGIPPDKN